MQKPFPQSYWVQIDSTPQVEALNRGEIDSKLQEGLFCAGHYPGSLNEDEFKAKLTGLLDCGIRRVINLIPEVETGADGKAFKPYQERLQEMAAQRDMQVECLRLGYPDGSTPQRSHMVKILDTIDASLAANEPLYLHCWGGHGRTGSTVGCFLVRHGASAQAAIDQIVAWRQPLPRNHYPFEGKQEAFVRSWHKGE